MTRAAGKISDAIMDISCGINTYGTKLVRAFSNLEIFTSKIHLAPVDQTRPSDREN